MNDKELHKTGESRQHEFKTSFGKETIQTELQDYPEIQFTVESLGGFTRSGMDVSSQDTRKLGDKLDDNQKKIIELIKKK